MLAEIFWLSQFYQIDMFYFEISTEKWDKVSSLIAECANFTKIDLYLTKTGLSLEHILQGHLCDGLANVN